MLIPLQQWICDICGEIIQSIDDGKVEWLNDHKQNAYGFRIVHDSYCIPQESPYLCNNRERTCSSSHLRIFMEDSGLGYVLRFFMHGPYDQVTFQGPYVSDVQAYDEFMKRLTVPYYEEARLYWPHAIQDGYFDGQSEHAVYKEDYLKRLVTAYRKKKDS